MVVQRIALLLGVIASSSSTELLVLTQKGGKGLGLAGSIWVIGVLFILTARSIQIL
jgi:hypothetical protein